MSKPSAPSLAAELVNLAAEGERDAFLDHATDIQALHPRHLLPLVGAGIARQHIEIRVASLLGGSASLSGDLTLQTPVARERRGVHMSRFVAVAAALMDGKWESLEQAAENGVRMAAERQETDAATLGFEAKTVVWRMAPATGLRSPDSFHVAAHTDLNGGVTRTKLTLGASVMTACPCTAAYSHHRTRLDLAGEHGEALADTIMDGVLTYTHSQRVEVEVEVEAVPGFDLATCLDALGEATTMTHELLKRRDEHTLVRASHLRPQFIEDVVRDIAATLASRAPRHASECTLRISARALESIHAHDVSAHFEGRVADVINVLRA